MSLQRIATMSLISNFKDVTVMVVLPMFGLSICGFGNEGDGNDYGIWNGADQAPVVPVEDVHISLRRCRRLNIRTRGLGVRIGQQCKQAQQATSKVTLDHVRHTSISFSGSNATCSPLLA